MINAQETRLISPTLISWAFERLADGIRHIVTLSSRLIRSFIVRSLAKTGVTNPLPVVVADIPNYQNITNDILIGFTGDRICIL